MTPNMPILNVGPRGDPGSRVGYSLLFNKNNSVSTWLYLAESYSFLKGSMAITRQEVVLVGTPRSSLAEERVRV